MTFWQAFDKINDMRIDKKHWLFNTPIAHRGLWNENIPENSILAYKNAVNNGFAIEIDLFCSTDGVLFSFHDDDLFRMTGKEGKIYQKDSAFIKSLTLNGTDQKIPTFRDVLFCVNGKVPILIEIKNQPDESIVERVLDELFEYEGEYAIQSFNPLYILKVKKIAPHIIRGVLGTSEKITTISKFSNFVIKNCSLNFLIKPDFISYEKNSLKNVKKKAKNKALLAWTVVTINEQENALKLANNVIFENYLPK